MSRLVSLASLVALGLLTACSGAPQDDAADYELDMTDPSQPPASSSSSSGGGSEGASSSSGSDPASEPAPTPDTDTTGSSSSGSSSSSGGSIPTTPPPPPAPTAVTVKIDGAAITVTDTKLWSEVSGPGKYNIFINVVGAGIATGSDIHIPAVRVGTGCLNTENFIVYRPEGDTQFMPKTAACGLTISAIPTAVGGRFKGSFRGTLTSINTPTPRTHTLEVIFDVLREK